MTTAFQPATELDLIERVTHAECAQCGTRSPVDASDLVAGGNEDINDLLSLEGDCGCDDPLPNFLIVTESPLFDDAEIDGDHEIRDGSTGRWEYQVDHDFAARLGVLA